jgi:hypothetical protein
MSEVLDVANAFTTPLKVAWVVWVAWGIGQVYWYRFERASAAAPRSPSGARVPRRTAPARTARPTVSSSATPAADRLITPREVKKATPPSAAPVPPAAPVFDPLKAIVETFDPRDTSFDAIVADMERHIPRPRDEASRVH